MQSGISASQELLSQFNTLLSSDAHFGLLATISSEALQPLTLLTPSTGSFANDLSSLLAPHIKPNEALFVLLRRHAAPPRLVAVTYVPDGAPVRQKMLFASTRLTLVRELGTEHFRDTIFATTATELTAQGFERHDAHGRLDAPLTEEERSLGEVKRAEAEAGQGTGTREIHLSKSLAMPIGEDAIEALKELAGGEGEEGARGLVMLKINPDTEAVELVPSSSTPSSIPELVQTISTTEPRFTFFRFAHQYGGHSGAPVLFFYTCPATPGNRAIKARMLYPLMKRAVLAAATSEAGLTPEKRFEVEDPAEITEETVMEELHPKVTVRKGFSRPKRPAGRGAAPGGSEAQT